MQSNRTDCTNKKTRLQRSKQLAYSDLNEMQSVANIINFIFFTHEKLFTCHSFRRQRSANFIAIEHVRINGDLRCCDVYKILRCVQYWQNNDDVVGNL